MRYGLVLEGGGAKGAFHVGAVKALREKGYEFGGVTGTSIGALNGAMIAQDDFDLLYEIWCNAMPSMLIDANDEILERILGGARDKESLKYMIKLAKSFVANRGVPIDRAQGFINTYIDEDKLRKSPIDYGLVTVSTSDNWEALEVFKEDIPYGMLKQYILASAYFPIFNRPTIDGKSFIDGGVYNNCPVNPLIYKGYTNIIAVRTGSKMPSRKVVDGTVSVSYINPSESLGKTLDFRNEHVKYNLNLGYYDALRFTDKLIGKKYYVKHTPKAEVINYFENLDYKVYEDWANALGVNGNKRELMSRVIEYIANKMELDSGIDSVETLVRLLETVADGCGIERFRIYSVIEFVEAIRRANAPMTEILGDTAITQIVTALKK